MPGGNKKTATGRKHRRDTRLKIARTMKGKRWVIDCWGNSKRVGKEHVGAHLDRGWRLGRARFF